MQMTLTINFMYMQVYLSLCHLLGSLLVTPTSFQGDLDPKPSVSGKSLCQHWMNQLPVCLTVVNTCQAVWLPSKQRQRVSVMDAENLELNIQANVWCMCVYIINGHGCVVSLSLSLWLLQHLHKPAFFLGSYVLLSLCLSSLVSKIQHAAWPAMITFQ